MKLTNIAKFERKNDNRFAINVIKYTDVKGNKKKVTNLYNPYLSPLLVSKNPNPDAERINLLLLEKNGRHHYTLITSLGRLFNCHKGRFSETNIHKNHWCDRCLRTVTKKGFELHKKICLDLTINGKVTSYSTLSKHFHEFSDQHKTVQPSYIVYADFESVLSKDFAKEDTPANVIQMHIPVMAAYTLVPVRTSDKEMLPIEYKSFYGDECIHDFLKSLVELGMRVKEWYNLNAYTSMSPLTPEEVHSHENADKCYIGGCKFLPENVKCMDHDKISGKYIGPACSKCNLSRKVTKYLPIIFHNLRGYDIKHIMRYGAKNFPHWEMYPIVQSGEKFLGMRISKAVEKFSFRFLDSLQFLNSSLDAVAKTMDPIDFVHASTLPFFAHTRHSKAVLPYSYITGTDILEQPCASLPPYASFYDPLSKSIPISEDEYNLAQQRYQDWQCTCLKDYLEIYLQIDVYLLADCFEAFRKLALEEDGLEPTHFYSIPGLSFASAFKMTGVKVALLDDSIMYEFFEKSIRGGITFVNKHYAATEKGKSEILYLDANNLYGFALSEALPFADFVWETDQARLQTMLSELPSMDCSSSERGYTIEVDLVIPDHLHDQLDDFPLAPSHEVPPPQLYDNGLGTAGQKTKKLITSHLPKTNYIVHFRLLQQFLELGAQITKVHRAVLYRQAPIFKSYIDYNTARRAQCSSPFKRNYYKLKNNALFGKTCENERNRLNVRVCNTGPKMLKYASLPTFERSVRICQDLHLLFMSPKKITLEKPIYIGQSVLDVSKWLMYSLFYKTLKNYETSLNCGINLLAGDTDSFFIECRNISVYDCLIPQMIQDGVLDTSNYDVKNPLYSRNIASKIGVLKDESGGSDPFVEAFFLQPKCYSLLTQSQQNTKKAKGVQSRVVQNELTHNDYREIYNRFSQVFIPNQNGPFNQPLSKRQCRIGSVNHQLYTFESLKIALACRDTKRLWLGQNRSVAFGHYCIPLEERLV
jgi:hypothetical protein